MEFAVYKRYIGPSGGGGANAVHDCRRRAFDQRVFVTSRHDMCGLLLPSPYVGGQAGGMSWCRQLIGWLLTSGLSVIISLPVRLSVIRSHISVTRSTSMEWTDHLRSHWSDHPTQLECPTNALTAATVIKPLHMLLQAGVPDPHPAATGVACGRPLLPVPASYRARFSMTVPDRPAALNLTID